MLSGPLDKRRSRLLRFSSPANIFCRLYLGFLFFLDPLVVLGPLLSQHSLFELLLHLIVITLSNCLCPSLIFCYQIARLRL